jgi:hypothetical protein
MKKQTTVSIYEGTKKKLNDFKHDNRLDSLDKAINFLLNNGGGVEKRK